MPMRRYYQHHDLISKHLSTHLCKQQKVGGWGPILLHIQKVINQNEAPTIRPTVYIKHQGHAALNNC